eukprot:Gb_23314 [translate_table: standard]
MQSGRADYAKAPVLYLPYPIMVEMLHRFENGSFWFQDNVVLVDEDLIHHITRLPIHDDKIDLREEARQMGREMIIQKLYPGYKEVDIWNKSNGFIINQITNEGAKWVARIMAKRLIGVEASTYLSHQWVAIAAKMYRRPFPMPCLVVVICMEALGPPGWTNPNEQPRLNSYSSLKRKRGDTKDRVDDAYLGRFYLMLRWLNDGPKRSKKLPEYIKKQWREAQWTKDDKTTYASLIVKYLPNSNFKAQRMVVIDHPLTSPMAQYDYWAINKAHFVKEPYSMAWSPPDLPIILFLEVQGKVGTVGKEKEKKKSSTKGSKSSKSKHSKSGFASQGHSSHNKEQRTSGEERKKIEIRRGQRERIARGKPEGSQHLIRSRNHHTSVYIVPPPSLQKVREKRKGRFVPTMQILNDSLTTQAINKLITSTTQELMTRVEELELELIHQAQEEKDSLSQSVNLLLQETSELGALPSMEQATMATEVLPDVCPHVHLPRRKALAAKEAPPIPPEMHTRLSQLESKIIGLRRQIFGDSIQLNEKEEIVNEMQLEADQKDHEIFNHIEEI